MAKFPIIKRKFSPGSFQPYCGGIGNQPWVQRIVLHNTDAPSLASRPGGILTSEHIDNLHHYYAVGKGWSGGPHLFVDTTGIWVFNPLDDPGVHSMSYNSSSWGVEMLGDYETESFTSGLGLSVSQNASAAVAILARTLGWSDVNGGRLILHKEDPATTHDCPGKNVIKADFVGQVNRDLFKMIWLEQLSRDAGSPAFEAHPAPPPVPTYR